MIVRNSTCTTCLLLRTGLGYNEVSEFYPNISPALGTVQWTLDLMDYLSPQLTHVFLYCRVDSVSLCGQHVSSTVFMQLTFSIRKLIESVSKSLLS